LALAGNNLDFTFVSHLCFKNILHKKKNKVKYMIEFNALLMGCNSNHSPGWRSSEYLVFLNAFTTILWIKAGSM